MEDLHSLLHSLNRHELKLIRTSLTCFGSRIEPETKALKLFEYLVKHSHEAPDFSACSRQVYSKKDDKRLHVLKTRLKAKILDAVTLDINIDKPGVLNELDHAAFKVKKKLIQFQFLYRKTGNHPFVLKLINEVIGTAKKFELYGSLAEALKFKKYLKGLCKGLDDFNRINKEIAFYDYCEQAGNKANDDYYQLILRTDFNGKSERSNIQKLINKSIKELNKDYKYTQSSKVGYYLKILEFAYFMNNDNYETAREACLELLSVINNNKSVYRKQRVGIAYDYIGECDIYLKDYGQAVFNFQSAQKHFPLNRLNYLISKEQEFYALFYDNKLEEATKVAKQLLRGSSVKQGEFRFAKYSFLKANVLFKKKDYKEALKILNRSQEISKDKEGWDIAVRVLTIMTLLELERKDEAALHLESLRKHMDKYSRKNKKKGDKERNNIILKMLQQLERQSFVFDKNNSKVIDGLTLLGGDNKKYRWECLTPELVPFHEWYAAKAGYKLPETKIVPVARARRKKEKVLVLR